MLTSANLRTSETASTRAVTAAISTTPVAIYQNRDEDESDIFVFSMKGSVLVTIIVATIAAVIIAFFIVAVCLLMKYLFRQRKKKRRPKRSRSRSRRPKVHITTDKDIIVREAIRVDDSSTPSPTEPNVIDLHSSAYSSAEEEFAGARTFTFVGAATGQVPSNRPVKAVVSGIDMYYDGPPANYDRYPLNYGSRVKAVTATSLANNCADKISANSTIEMVAPPLNRFNSLSLNPSVSVESCDRDGDGYDESYEENLYHSFEAAMRQSR